MCPLSTAGDGEQVEVAQTPAAATFVQEKFDDHELASGHKCLPGVFEEHEGIVVVPVATG